MTLLERIVDSPAGRFGRALVYAAAAWVERALDRIPPSTPVGHRQNGTAWRADGRDRLDLDD